MPYLHQFDYIFAIGTIAAALDAYNIGANDVANSFATSVASRSLTLRQACVAAGLCEFLGAVLVGARVSGTIKNGIISLSIFRNNAGVQMLGFTCALVASATWLMIATSRSWPVSTTYSIVSALAGTGVALGGAGAVQWGWNGGKGLGTIFAGMGIAPLLAAGFGATIYLITKYAVLERKNPVRAGLMFSPVYFFTVAAVLTMSIVYKGAPELKLDKLSESTIAAAIVGTGAVIAVLSALFWLPFVYAKVIKRDYTLRWYHFFFGPLLWSRPAPEVPLDAAVSSVPDYRTYGRDHPVSTTGHDQHDTENRMNPTLNPTPTSEHGSTPEASEKNMRFAEDGEVNHQLSAEHKKTVPHSETTSTNNERVPLSEIEATSDSHPIEGAWILPKNLWIILRYRIPKVLLHGSSVDVHKMQAAKGTPEERRMAEMHERARQYDNETEHLFSFLQVLTACTNSFAHGSNDTANAIGPFAAIYYVWSNGVVTPSNSPTPVWMLAFGAGMIVIGLATYGYNIMSVLGNRLTMHSPSRGFSMEFGAAITVLLASQYAIPVSSTMCIVGATAGVGIVSSGWRGLNWKSFAWIFAGWVLTVPIAGTAAGCLTGLFINAPRW